MVQNPTNPSAVGTMDGSSRLRRPSAWSSPSTLADTAPSEPMAIDHGLEDRQVDGLARAGAARGPHRSRDGDGGVGACEPLAEPAARLHRLRTRPTAAADRPAERLQHKLVDLQASVDVGTGGAERRDGDDDGRRRRGRARCRPASTRH